MSETFFIKKTAFDDFSSDLVQRDADSFVIGPGELNGPGGAERDSDLDLYGFGSLKWGEGVNQNQYRLLESNACPEKEAGDFLVGTDDPNGYVPGTGSYVPSVGSPVNGAIPKDEYDLGIGNGITNPLIGQQWYNTTRGVLYIYETAGWATIFREATDDLTAHINDHTVHLRDGQNEFLDGLILGGSPASLQSHDVNQLIGISDVDGTVQDQIDLMVDSRGDTMTGHLTLNSTVDLRLEGGIHRITNNDGGGNFNIRIGHEWTTQEVYTATNQGAIHLKGTHEGETPKFAIRLGDTDTTTIGNPVSFTGTFEFTNDGNVSASAAAPTDVDHLTRKDYVDLKAPINSPTFTGTPRAPTPPATDDSTRIATTAWVGDVGLNKMIYSGSSSSTAVPATANRVYVACVGGGGGGASGGDGGNWTGGDGGTGGTTSVYIQGYGWVYAYGGQGGQGTQTTEHIVHVLEMLRRAHRNGAEGISQSGTTGKNGNFGQGGHGGSNPLGKGGYGNTTSSSAQAGVRGGGGAGGRGQDNASGCGGCSGFYIARSYPCTPGGTISWTIGGGGARGVPPAAGVYDRYGGYGGAGYVVLMFGHS